jgi:hypothetical protein
VTNETQCRSVGLAGWLIACAAAAGTLGCTPRVVDPIDADLRPILRLNGDADWTAAFNRLSARGAETVGRLMRTPALAQPCAPDSLDTLLSASLVALLADAGEPPPLSCYAYEISFDLLHLDPKVGGKKLGTLVWCEPRGPASWLDLYPADFQHAAAAQVDVELDRRKLVEWYARRQAAGLVVSSGRQLRPSAGNLLPLLTRRYADVWTYDPEPGAATLVSTQAPLRSLLQLRTTDYNLVRAACVWLGGQRDEQVQRLLIELVGHESPIAAHNARFALGYSRDPRIRDVLSRFGGE